MAIIHRTAKNTINIKDMIDGKDVVDTEYYKSITVFGIEVFRHNGNEYQIDARSDKKSKTIGGFNK